MNPSLTPSITKHTTTIAAATNQGGEIARRIGAVGLKTLMGKLERNTSKSFFRCKFSKDETELLSAALRVMAHLHHAARVVEGHLPPLETRGE